MQIRWTVTARADLFQAFDFIAKDSPNAALSVLERIESGAEHLKQHPDMGRISRMPETRELVIPKTSFILVYRMKGDFVEILALIHSARKWPEDF